MVVRFLARWLPIVVLTATGEAVVVRLPACRRGVGAIEGGPAYPIELVSDCVVSTTNRPGLPRTRLIASGRCPAVRSRHNPNTCPFGSPPEYAQASGDRA